MTTEQNVIVIHRKKITTCEAEFTINTSRPLSDTFGAKLLALIDQDLNGELPMVSLSQAKYELNKNLSKGDICQCCGRFAKLYHRKITSAMAYGLILMYNESKRLIEGDNSDYIHVENFFKPLNIAASIRADIPKLRFWGLIEPAKLGSKDGNPHSGYYRLTPFGRNFVMGGVSVPKYLKIYNNECYGEVLIYGKATKPVTIITCLDSMFNYDELMNS